MKATRRILSLVLALLIAALCAAPAFAGSGPGYTVDKTPTILIHGILQSDVYLIGDDGKPVLGENGKPIEGMPKDIDANAIIMQLLPQAIFSLLFQHDMGLIKKGRAIVNDIFKYLQNDGEGQPVNNMQVVRYPNSLKDSTPEERRRVYGTLPMEQLGEIIGEENLYFFTYDSFGNHRDSVDELYAFIKKVRKEHKVDKVNLVPISLGGTYFNALIDYYPETQDWLNKVVLVIGAMDGSKIIGDMFTGNLGVQNKNLYYDMVPQLMGEGYLSYLINIALRLLPKKLVYQVFDMAVQSLVGDILSYCTNMWTLVPMADYNKAAKLWLMDGKHDEVRVQAERYYQAQKRSKAHIKALKEEKNVKMYAIAEYDFPMYAIAGSWREVNSDGVIHLDSTSMGATAGWINTPLPKGYEQQKCKNHNHISPDGIVDASTCLLPDHTWFFKNQAHEATGRSDIVIRQVIRLVAEKEYRDVIALKDEWPQFNQGREVNGAKGDLAEARKVDLTTLSEADKKELQAAVAAAEDMFERTIADTAGDKAIQNRLRAILVKIGVRGAPEEDKAAKWLDPILWFFNAVTYYCYGPRGFIDPFWKIWTQKWWY